MVWCPVAWQSLSRPSLLHAPVLTAKRFVLARSWAFGRRKGNAGGRLGDCGTCLATIYFDLVYSCMSSLTAVQQEGAVFMEK